MVSFQLITQSPYIINIIIQMITFLKKKNPRHELPVYGTKEMWWEIYISVEKLFHNEQMN